MPEETKPTDQTNQTPPAQPQEPLKDQTPHVVPTPEPKKEDQKPDPIMAQMFSDLGVQIDQKPAEIPATPKPETKKDEPTVAATAHAAVTSQDKPADQPPVETPKTDDAPVTPAVVEHVDVAALIANGIKKGFEEYGKKEKPADKPKEEQKQPEEDLTGWTDEEVDALDLAKYAETKNPDLYKGQADKVRKFKKGLDDLIAAKRAEDPEWNPDNDKDLAEYVDKNKPNYRQGDRRKLDRERFIEEADARAKKVIEQKEAQINSKLREIELRPVIERSIAGFNQTLSGYMADPKTKDTLTKVSEVYQKEGMDAAAKKYPLHVQAVVPIIQTAGRVAQTLLAHKNGLLDLNQNDPIHRYVGDFIRNNDAYTASRPEAEQIQVIEINGRRVQQKFIPSDEYAKLQAANDPSVENYWTWTPQAYLNMLAIEARRQAGEAASRVDQHISAYQQPTPPQQPAAAPAAVPKQDNQPPAKQEPASPKATVSASPGAAPSPSTVTTGNPAMPSQYMSALNLTLA